jgi:hypothetical protein
MVKSKVPAVKVASGQESDLLWDAADLLRGWSVSGRGWKGDFTELGRRSDQLNYIGNELDEIAGSCDNAASCADAISRPHKGNQSLMGELSEVRSWLIDQIKYSGAKVPSKFMKMLESAKKYMDSVIAKGQGGGLSSEPSSKPVDVSRFGPIGGTGSEAFESKPRPQPEPKPTIPSQIPARKPFPGRLSSWVRQHCKFAKANN